MSEIILRYPIYQAVSRPLPTAAGYVGFMVDKMSMGQVFF
jgi:hypothetical protein